MFLKHKSQCLSNTAPGGDAPPSLRPAPPAELLPLASTSPLLLVSRINPSRLSATQHDYRTTALLCLTHSAQYCGCYCIKREVLLNRTSPVVARHVKVGQVLSLSISPSAGRTHIRARWLIPPCSGWGELGALEGITKARVLGRRFLTYLKRNARVWIKSQPFSGCLLYYYG